MTYEDNDFTYGFEIEGIFRKELRKKLLELEESLGWDTYLKGDGSVHGGDICRSAGIYDTYEIAHGTEYNIGIFNNLKDLLGAIKIFENGKNYYMDESCGLHLHIKPKRDIKNTKGLFWDLDLIKKLEEFADTKLCSCVKKRKGNRYCEQYNDFERFLEDYKYGEKYRFVRNHPSGTMEFRFLSPCKHKEENVEKFVKYLISNLSKQEAKKSDTIELEVKETVIPFDTFVKSTPLIDVDYAYSLGNNSVIKGKQNLVIDDVRDDLMDWAEEE